MYDESLIYIYIFYSSRLQSIGQMGPNLQAVAEARGAAAQLLAVCRREPEIDSESKDGVIPASQDVKGEVELR